MTPRGKSSFSLKHPTTGAAPSSFLEGPSEDLFEPDEACFSVAVFPSKLNWGENRFWREYYCSCITFFF